MTAIVIVAMMPEKLPKAFFLMCGLGGEGFDSVTVEAVAR